MIIYIGHASSFNYKEELYEPIQELEVEECEFILPHVDSASPTNSLERMKTIDLMIAEVSFSSTGLGIEIGWANALDIPVVCIHKSGTVPSTAISGVCPEVIVYDSTESLKEVVKKIAGENY